VSKMHRHFRFAPSIRSRSIVARGNSEGGRIPAEFNDRPRWGAACRGQRPRPIILELSESALRFLAPLRAASPPPPLPPLPLSFPPHAPASTTEPTSRTTRHSVVTSAEKVERGIRPGRCVERHARVAGCRRSHAHVHTHALIRVYTQRHARADGSPVISRETTRFRFSFLSFSPSL